MPVIGCDRRLPEKCREIFVLSCVEGLKYQEVADKFGGYDQHGENAGTFWL